jgi:2-hydroxy-3-oxopropionate reductase
MANPGNATKLAFLGTGLMGGPMCARLLKAGCALKVWNRTRSKAEPLAAHGAEVVDTAAACAQGADIVFIMLENGAVVEDVLFSQGVAAALLPGSIVVDMSSIAPSEAIGIAARLGGLSLKFLDAPVSGGTVGAGAGTLSIMIGGEAEAVAKVIPYFEFMGRPTHVGPTGTGQVSKLANQMIVASTIGAVAEALVFAARAGADPGLVRQALQGGFADSRILDLHGARMIERSFVPGGRTTNQIKDLENASRAAAEHGVELPFAGTALTLFKDLLAAHGDVDHSGLWLTLDERSRTADPA